MSAMGKKQLGINLIVSMLSYVISMIIGLYLTPYIVNNLGKEIYGFYGLANQIVNYITIISVALNSMASKYITVELVKNNQYNAKKYFSSVFYSNIFLSVIITPILVLIVWKPSIFLNISSRYTRDVQILFMLVFCAMIIRFTASVFGVSTYYTNRIDIRSFLGIVKVFIKILLYITVFTMMKPSIIYVGVVVLITECYDAISTYIVCRKLTTFLVIKKKFYDLSLVVKTIRVGIWNSFNQLGDLLLSSVDLVAANMFLGESATGSVSIIKTFPSLLSSIITAINSSFTPRITTRYAEGNIEDVVKETNFAQRLMATLTTTIVMLLMTWGEDLFRLWVPGNDEALLYRLSTIDICRMGMVGAVWPVLSVNTAMDKLKFPSLMTISCGICNVIGMALLTDYVGIYAIPTTTCILSFALYGVAIPVYAGNKLRNNWRIFIMPVFETIFCMLIIAVLIVPIKGCFVIRDWFDFICAGFLSGMMFLLICTLVYVKPRNLVSAIKILYGRIRKEG